MGGVGGIDGCCCWTKSPGDVLVGCCDVEDGDVLARGGAVDELIDAGGCASWPACCRWASLGGVREGDSVDRVRTKIEKFWLV